MTTAQRLRLVLALGIVNVILATVALSVGISGLSTEPSTGGRPSPGIAQVSPGPTEAPGVSNPTPTATQPTSTPPPTTEPSLPPTTEPSLPPTTEPSAVPVVSPEAPAPAPTRGPTLIASRRTPTPATGPAPAPAATPVPTPAPTPGKAIVGAPDRPDCPIQATKGSRASQAGEHEPDMTGSNGRACGHDKDVRQKTDKADKSAKPAKDTSKRQGKASKAADHGNRQPAAVEKPRREPRNAHRLRRGRRAR